MKNLTTTDLENILSNTASKKGFEVVGVNYLANQNPLNIQIQIRHKNDQKDVSIKDCASLTLPLSDAIEASKLIKQTFELEISSPGINEVLTTDREFQTFQGFPVEVTYIDKKKTRLCKKGLLHRMSRDHFKLNLKGKIINIPREDVIQVRLTTPSG